MIDPAVASALLFAVAAVCAPGAACGEPPPGFVRLADIAPSIRQDMRYAQSNNFTGRPVPGYPAPRCWLRRDVAEALAAAQQEAEAEGLSLVVDDCYRPPEATKAFVAWAQDASDQRMKAAYYPNVDKAKLFELGFISKTSAHTSGRAVDLAFVGLDFGTCFDVFDPASATNHPGIGATARANRTKLVALMDRHGFENAPQEWWHFTSRLK